MKRYSVAVYDVAGEFDRFELSTFAEVPSLVARLRVKYPGKVVQAFNLDRCDYDTNGLTDEEREAVDSAEAVSK